MSYTTIFLIVIASFVLLKVITRMQKNNIAEKIKPTLQNWILSQNGIFDELLYAIYTDFELLENRESIIVVGSFPRLNKMKDAGFLLEIKNSEIVLSKLFFPYGIISWHKSKARDAKLMRLSLYKILCLSEEAHHNEYPEWKEVL